MRAVQAAAVIGHTHRGDRGGDFGGVPAAGTCCIDSVRLMPCMKAPGSCSRWQSVIWAMMVVLMFSPRQVDSKFSTSLRLTREVRSTLNGVTETNLSIAKT